MSRDGELAQHYSNVWKHLTAPVRPSEDVLRVYREAIGKFAEKRVLVLGSTPELLDMATDSKAKRIVSIERSQTVIEAFRTLGEGDWSNVQFVVGDWLEDRPEFHGYFNCIMCDGGILFLEYPGQWGQLFRIVRDYLEPGGVFAAKGWTEPPGERDYDTMIEAYIDAFNAGSTGRNRQQTQAAFMRLASTLRLVGLVGATLADGSFDQKILVDRGDDLIARLEREFPDPALIAINHAALKYLARSQPGRWDVVSGVGYQGAQKLLKENGLDSKNFPLSDPPIEGSTYVFVANRI